MPSPFPGMDPYLEDPAFWPDFHRRFITHCADILTEKLPDAYEARIDETVRVLERPFEPAKSFYPDVAVTAEPRLEPATGGMALLTTAEVIAATLPDTVLEEVRDVWIEVLHRPERSVVTIIEVLSPANKGADYQDYLRKRRALLNQPIHLVEIDLLLGGRRPPIREPWPPGDYSALVARAERRPKCEVYTWRIEQPFRPIPVPLKAPDPDVQLSLAEVFTITYDRGRYRRSLRYGNPLPMPMSPDRMKWILEKCNAGMSQ